MLGANVTGAGDNGWHRLLAGGPPHSGRSQHPYRRDAAISLVWVSMLGMAFAD